MVMPEEGHLFFERPGGQHHAEHPPQLQVVLGRELFRIEGLGQAIFHGPVVDRLETEQRVNGFVTAFERQLIYIVGRTSKSHTAQQVRAIFKAHGRHSYNPPRGRSLGTAAWWAWSVGEVLTLRGTGLRRVKQA